MGVLFTNNASTTLSAAISSTSATSISVASSSTFPSPGAGEYFYATIDDGTNIEIVKVTAVSGTTWTVVRASDNTSAATFANGTTIQLRAAAALLTDIQQNIAAKSANQTVYNATTASSATTYNVGTDPQNEANAMVFLDGVMQHHDTFSFSGSTLTFDAAPSNGLKLEVIIDNLINLQSSNLTVDTFTATNGQTAFTLSDTPAAEDNLIVFIEGVFQNQDSYSISTNTLTMSAGVTTNRKVVVYIINPVNIGTPSDGTVTSAKLSGNITTPGTLTVGSHDVAFDSPTFVVDNSNSRVGLGTASPSVPVDIVGDVKMSSTLDLTSHLDMPDSANVKLGTGDDLLLYHDGTNSYIANTTGALKIATETSGIAVTIGHTTSETTVADNLTVTGTITGTLATAAQANITSLGTLTALTGGTGDFNWDSGTLVVDSSANKVGIGTASPSTNLDISPSSGAAELRIAGAEGQEASIRLYADEGDDAADIKRFLTDTSGNLKIQHYAGSAFVDSMVINSSGNVGIGTASPATLLELSANTSSGQNTLRFTDEDAGIVADQNIGKIEFYSNDASGAGGSVRGYMLCAAEDTSPSTYLAFATNPSAEVTGGVERMRIDASGNVGIGETSPANLLHVKASDVGAAPIDTALMVLEKSGTNYLSFMGANTNTQGVLFGDADDNDVGQLIYNHSSNHMAFSTAATERMRIDSSGNVGIGTASPQDKLQVKGGNITIASTDGASRYFGFTSSASEGTYVAKIESDHSANWGGNLKFFTGPSGGGNAERMRISSAGKFIVGDTSALNSGGALGSFVFSGGQGLFISTVSQSNGEVMGFVHQKTSVVGTIAINSSSTTYNTSSDARLKNVLGDAKGLEIVNQLNPVNFEWKESKKVQDGLIAQEVEEIVPNAVSENSAGYYQMDYSKLVTPLIKSIQEQQEQIEELKQEIEALKDG